MQVRLRGVAAVAAAPDRLPALHPLAGLHGDAVLSEMGEEGELAVPEIEHHVVAGGVGRVGLADRLVRQPVDGDGDRAGRGRQDWPVPAMIVLGPEALAGMARTVADDDEVEREALAAVGRMVVLLDGPAAPEYLPFPSKGRRSAARVS